MVLFGCYLLVIAAAKGGTRLATEVSWYVGKRIKERREQLRISRADFGRRLGLSQQAVSAIERGGEISATHLFDASTILGEPISYFFDGIEEKWAEPPAAASKNNDADRRTQWPGGRRAGRDRRHDRRAGTDRRRPATG